MPKEAKKVFTPEESAEMLSYLVQNAATKEDFAVFATKEDLIGFATKEDLVGLATKEDLKAFATKEDLGRSEQRIMDYTDKRIGQAEDRIIGRLYKEDEKVNEVIRTIEVKKVITKKESNVLQGFGPFPKLAS